MIASNRGVAISCGLLVLFALFPLVSSKLGLDISTVTNVFLFAIAAMSVNLLVGYTGINAFGNAAFFGLGAYGALLSIKYYHADFLVAMLVGIVSGLLGGLILGPFLLRRRGIYFSLLAIAFGQVFYFIAYRFTDVTGGEDGMTVTRPPVALLHYKIDDHAFYYLSLAALAVALLAFWIVVRSPFGKTLQAIRQNELRVRYLGLNTDRFIFVALVVSATLAGLGGTLFGLSNSNAYPLMLDWHQSGDFVLMTVLGGAGTLWGPFIGATIFVIGKDVISSITPLWQIFIGGLFVACVLGFPNGILGSIFSALEARRTITAPSVPPGSIAVEPHG